MIPTAQALVAPGKGILAADESTPTISQALQRDRHRVDRGSRAAPIAALFTTRGLGEYISGVILFEETLRQTADDGTPLPQLLRERGHLARHQGRHRHDAARRLRRASWSPQGLDGLARAPREYKAQGARFAKWRAVFRIADGTPDATRHRGQRACARALRGAVPGGRASYRSSSPRC